MIISSRQLVQEFNSVDKFREAQTALKAAHARTNEYAEQLAEYKKAEAWIEMATPSQQMILDSITIEQAARHIKLAKEEAYRKKERARRAEAKRNRPKVFHLFPIIPLPKADVNAMPTGTSLDRRYKSLTYTDENTTGVYLKRCATIWKDIIVLRTKELMEEFRLSNPRACAVVGRTGLYQATAEALALAKERYPKYIKGFRLVPERIGRMHRKRHESRTAVGGPDSQLPVMYTSMRRNWK